MELLLPNNTPLEFFPGLPQGYTGPVFRGTIAVSAKNNLTEVVIQELKGEGYSIRFVIGNFLKKIHASGWLPVDGLYSTFMLKNGIHKKIESLGKIHLRQDCYSLFFNKSAGCSAQFEKDEEFRILDLFYSPVLLKEIQPYFPELETYIHSPYSLFAGDKTSWVLPSMRDIYNQILNCRYDDATRQFYFDLKVRELLYQLLQNAFSDKTDDHFTPFEIARIHEAKNILEDYINKKPLTIRELARRVALNEFKLKKGFRRYYHAGIFEWLLEQKMQHAKYLILSTNKPVKEVGMLIGYPRITNFITAFRRRFGTAPGALRR